jgi:hypothetical protein
MTTLPATIAAPLPASPTSAPSFSPTVAPSHPPIPVSTAVPASATVVGSPPAPPTGVVAPVEHVDAAAAAAAGESFVLNVPFRSQYDQSPYQLANCGPASLGMVLEAYGANVPTAQLRGLADQIQGTSGYNDGVALDTLAGIARRAGLQVVGLSTSDGHYRRWTIGDLIMSVRHGYPVITLVHYASLPGHAGSSSTSDHYVVVVGVTAQGFVINDPAYTGQDGYHLLLRPDQLLVAWQNAEIQDQAAAFLPPSGRLTLMGDAPSGGLPAAVAPIPALSSAYPAPAVMARAAPATLGPPPPPPGFVRQAVAVPTSSATITPTSVPSLATQAWAAALSGWDHQGVPTATRSPRSATTGADDPTLVLADNGSKGPSPWPVLVVLMAIGGAALAIVKAPAGDQS